ncbi:hypothetical protein [Acidithiobacillus sp.]|uniref:hypothetical protein n=1 Tax=Acidithiobacillus sp. TaxID=1872118 RepID=UPI00260BDE2A|nr:hypothetical protein [Acidithiobacillus sp.]MDD2751112.1 hypothetical protein [Acidithiobacillus sp.]MDD5278626.1 hypothetical protein [Acidithiobacillus sp.]
MTDIFDIPITRFRHEHHRRQMRRVQHRKPESRVACILLVNPDASPRFTEEKQKQTAFFDENHLTTNHL